MCHRVRNGLRYGRLRADQVRIAPVAHALATRAIAEHGVAAHALAEHGLGSHKRAEPLCSGRPTG